MNKAYKLPKILVIGTNPWREDGTSHTLMDIFSCWQPEQLALIYSKADLPYTNVASRFFQISEPEVLHSVFKPWKSVGKEVFSTEKVDSHLLQEENAIYANAHKKYSIILTLCREFVWLFGHWHSKALRDFVKDFNPDIIYVPIYPTIYMSWIQRYVLKLTGKPFACYLADDNYSYESCNSVWSYIHRFWLRKNVKWLATHCQQMSVIVEKEKEDTDLRFGTDSIILTKSIDFSNKPFVQKKLNNPIKFVYTGHLIAGRDKTMIKVCKAINESNAKSKNKIELYIYSQTKPNDYLMSKINTGACHFCGQVPRQKVQGILDNADVVLYLEALEGKERNLGRLSFSTKITDYLSSGKCIFAVGPEYIAPIDYLKRNDAAILSYNDDDIAIQLHTITNSPQLITDYGKKAYNCAVRNHEKSMIDARFIAAMKSIVTK